MRSFTKTASWTLALVLVLSVILSACSSGNNNNNSNSNSSSKSSPSSSASQSASAGSASASSEAAPEPIEFTLFVDHSWFWVDQWVGEVAEEITKRTGVSFKVTRASDANQLPVMLASGDVPDFIYSQRLDDRLANTEVSLPWNELIGQHAPDFQIDPLLIANNTRDDGNFYTIKNAFATEEEWKANKFAMPSPGTPSLSIRKDILEKLGNPKLETLEDLENVFGMVKQQFPDMTPLVLGDAPNWLTRYFATEFGVDPGTTKVYEENGSIRHVISNPGTLEMYKYLNRLYRQGYLTAENLAYEYQQFLQQVNSGKAFAFTRSTVDHTTVNGAMKSAGVEGEFTVLVNSLGGAKAAIVDDGVGWSGTYITKSNKNPERAIKFMQFMLSEEGQNLSAWGVEGKHYTMAPEGYPVLTPEVAADKAASYDEFMRKYGTAMWIFGMSAVKEGMINYNPALPELNERYLQAKSIIKYRPELIFVKPPADSDELNIYNQITDLVNNEQVKVILAGSEADAVKAYDEMIAKAESIGLKKLEDWMTERYVTVKERFGK